MSRQGVAVTVYLSPSRLNRFAECPRCFWLQVNEGIDRPSGPFPSLPAGMDRAIKAHFDRCRVDGRLPPELRDELPTLLDSTDATNDPTDLVLEPDREFLARCRRWHSDPSYVDEDLGVVLRGAVDDLLRTADGSLVVTDYKTRGYPPRRERGAPPYYVRQLGCYVLMLRGAGHPTADYGLLLYYYPDAVGEDGTFRFHAELRRVPVDVAVVRAELRRAVETLQGPIPDHRSGCAFCAWNAAELG